MPESKVVIWDMDGVIADTAPYHLKAWQDVFRKRGVNFTEEDFRRKFGRAPIIDVPDFRRFRSHLWSVMERVKRRDFAGWGPHWETRSHE